MSKILFKILMLSIMMLFATPCFADGEGNDNNNGSDSIPSVPENPFGDGIEIPIKTIKHDRSLSEPIHAYYYNNEYIIEIDFEENIGAVAVVVRNSNGVVVYNMQHDTTTEGGCTIFLPTNTDCYSIDITGSRYYGYGSICL